MARTRPCKARCLLALSTLAVVALVGCNQKNSYMPPPPAVVGVTMPEKHPVTNYLELTGTTQAINSVDLVARVEGFLQAIKAPDGALVEKGDVLFVIEPEPYQAKLKQARAGIAEQQAALARASSEYRRQQRLIKQNASSEAELERWQAERDQAQAGLDSAAASAQLAAIDLGYTKVTAPFDGRLSAHLVDVGSLVGAGAPTTLATLVQLDPIWVYFSVSERDVLRIKESLRRRGITYTETPPVTVEVGLQSETGYPHQGKLDYIAPQIDTSTGTLTARAVVDNADRIFLPGLFVRVRVPVGKRSSALLVPERALGTDQGGQYLLTVNAKDVVEQHYVKIGPSVDGMLVIEDGIGADERVVVSGIQRAIPGAKVAPEQAATKASDATATPSTSNSPAPAGNAPAKR